VTPASIVLAAALVAWGPVAPAPEPGGAGDGAAAAGPDTERQPDRPPTAVPPSPTAPVARPPAPSIPPVLAPPLIVRGPIEVVPRGAPVLVASPHPAGAAKKPLYKRWLFWVIAGGFLASAIGVTYAATRPKPQPYTGNAPPYLITFP
jgi:hypothetical protein